MSTDESTTRTEWLNATADGYDPKVGDSLSNNAARAAFAVAHVQDHYEWEEDYAFSDYLADFLHLCTAVGLDVSEVVADALGKHDTEREECRP